MQTLIRGGRVYDGTDSNPYYADILLRDGRIAAIGGDVWPEGVKAIDAHGLAVTPGFIDMHRHCDIAPLRDDAFGELELAQGITTTAVGNCGLAPVPVKPARRRESCDFIQPVVGEISAAHAFRTYRGYFAALEKAKPSINMGVLAGAGAIKTCVKGFVDTPYTAAELDEAAAYVKAAMDEGAYGVSLGIMYQPECWSTADELARVVRPAAQAGGLLTTHIRGEGDSLVPSVQEVLDIARRAGMRLHISHFKATGTANWHDAIYRAMECIENARVAGQPVTADFYPYTGGATTLLSLVPPSLLAGGGDATLRQLAKPEGKQLLRREIYKTHPGWDNMALSIGWERILIAGTQLPAHAAYGGRDIASLAAGQGYDDPSDFVCDLLVAEQGRVGIVVLSMHPDDVDAVARLPWTAIISDALYGGGSNPHPRLYGAFPRAIHEYVLQRGVLSLPQAIHKMAGLPAEILGLEGRGTLRVGNMADICLFDPGQLRDNATYTDSRRLASGMARVLIGGETVWQNGQFIQSKQGSLLRRNK